MVELLAGLARANLAATAGILLVLALRVPARRLFGARLAYGLWVLPALAAAAVFVPARVTSVAPVSSSPAFAAPLDEVVLPRLAAGGASLDPAALLLALWAAGALAALAFTAWNQRRFVLDAKEGGVGPAVVGVFAPRIIEPHDFAERFTPDEQRLVLAHEHAHITRQDSRINGLVVLIQCLNWFNPLIHLGAHTLRIDQELACDEAVIFRFPSARPLYANALLKAQLAIRPLPLGCYWPSGTRHPLFERICMINRDHPPGARRLAGAACLALLCTAAGLGAWAAQPPRTQPAAQPPAPPPPGIIPAATPAQAVPAPPANVALTNARDGARPAPVRPKTELETAIGRGDLRQVALMGGSAAELTSALLANPDYVGDKTLLPQTAFIENLDGRIALTIKSTDGKTHFIAPKPLAGIQPPATAPHTTVTYVGEGPEALARAREMVQQAKGAQ